MPAPDYYRLKGDYCAYRLCAGKNPLANRIPERALIAIEDIVRSHANGASAPEILRALPARVPLRTLQYRLKYLVTRSRLTN